MASSFRGTGLAQRAALGLTQVRFLSRVQQINPEVKKLKRLAVPAKAKRVLSVVDSLFTPQNLDQDEGMLHLLAENRGWMSIKGLQKFPQLRGWCTPEVFDVAFVPSVKRYETRARPSHINRQLQLSHVRSKKFGKAFKKSTQRIRSDLLQDGWEDVATEDELASLLNVLRKSIKPIPRAGPPLPSMDTIRGPPERRKLIHGIRTLFSQQHHSRVNPFIVLAVRLAASELYNEFKGLSIEKEERKMQREKETARLISSKSLPRFQIPEEMHMVVAMSHQGVERVCQEIVDDLHYCNDVVPFLGIDVEYATLEQDLRQLPAMLQLASRNVVGLIWLDKLPKHGRELGSWDNSKLLDILGDRDIYKVGVGARHDCLSISEWWGKVPINGITDFDLLPPEWIAKLLRSRMHQGKSKASRNKMLQDQEADDLQTSELRLSLANWCEVLLGKELVKKKIQGKKRNRQKATSHWRTANLSTQMQVYAAEDAVVSRKLFKPLMSVISKRDLDEFVSSHSISRCIMHRT